MLRKIALLTLVCLCLVGCGQTVTLLDFLPPEGESVFDLQQRVVTLGTESNSNDDDIPSLFEHAENTVVYDAIIKRLHTLEDQYNCKIEIENEGNSTEMITKMLILSATGDSTIDIMFGHNSNIMGNLAVGGVLHPLTQLREYINYENSEKFGSPGVLEAAMVDGVPYAVQPVQWPGFTNTFAFYITYNRDLFKEYSMPDLHEYYENETWNFATYENLFSMYETMADEDLDLSYIQRGFFAMSAMIANGVKFCDYDGETFSSDFNSDKSYNAIDWSLKLYDRYKDIILFHDYAYGHDEFCDKKVMMMPTSSKTLTHYVPYKSDFEFGVMPFPSGPDGVYGQWATFIESIRGFGISNFSDLTEASAIILNDLCDPFPEVTTENGLQDYYREQIFFTDLDTQIFLEVGKDIRHVFYTVHGRAIYNFQSAITGATSVAQLIQTHEKPIEELIIKSVRPNYEKYIYEHLNPNN